MKGQIKKYFPGGNTPKGFYSYYNYILPQRKAKKIFCIKGGPGVGKSTLMKNIAQYFIDRGEQVELLWCSSDPDSLDGVVLKDRAIALVDGTSPHVTDPITPGAVDEIVNLGDCWNERGIMVHKESIIQCNEKISHNFNLAYTYLRCAGEQNDAMTEILRKTIHQDTIHIIYKELEDFMQNVYECDSKQNILKGKNLIGEEKKAFSSAITPEGLKNHLTSLQNNTDNLVVIESPVGFPCEIFLEPIAEKLRRKGFDVEKYYCPMNPGTRIEHVVSQAANMTFITCNKYHGMELILSEEKNTKRINVEDFGVEKRLMNIYDRLFKDCNDNISKAVMYLKEAKSLHDELESYYISNMDFEKIAKMEQRLIWKIKSYAL